MYPVNFCRAGRLLTLMKMNKIVVVIILRQNVHFGEYRTPNGSWFKVGKNGNVKQLFNFPVFNRFISTFHADILLTVSVD